MRLIISLPTLPVATWKTRIGLRWLLNSVVALVGSGLKVGGAATEAVGIELHGPLADCGETLLLGVRQRRRIGVALVRPDVHVLRELADDFLAELAGLRFGPFRVVGGTAGLAADVHHEPDVGGAVVDGRDRRDGPVVDHPPALGHRDAETAVDRLDAALDVVDALVVVTFEGDREVDVRTPARRSRDG